VGEGGWVRDKSVDLDVDLSVGEERMEPSTQEQAETKQFKEVKEVVNVDVVEEPLDVEE
jgi:hypothetical protein